MLELTTSRIGKDIGVDPEVILATSHGRRSIDVLKIHQPELANWDYVRTVEGKIPQEYGQDAVEIPGARSLLDDLEGHSVPWCIVTSGVRMSWMRTPQLVAFRDFCALRKQGSFADCVSLLLDAAIGNGLVGHHETGSS